MAAPIQASASYSDYLKQNPTLPTEPSHVQAQVALGWFQKNVVDRQGLGQEAPEIQQQEWQNFRTKYNVPDIQAAQPFSQPVQPQAPVQVKQLDWADYNPNSIQNIGKDLAGATLSTAAGGVKGLSLGYLDPTAQAQKFAQSFGANNYSPEIANIGGEISGSILPFEGAAKGLNMGATALRAGIVKNIPFGVNSALNMAKGLKSFVKPATTPGMAGKAAIEGAALGAISQADSLKERLANTLGFAAGGAVMPPIVKGVNKLAPVLKAGIQKTFNPALVKTEAPTGLSGLSSKRTEQVLKKYNDLKAIEGLVEKESAKIQKTLDELESALNSGKVATNLTKLEAEAKAIRNRARFRKMTGEKQRVQKEKTEQQNGQKPSPQGTEGNKQQTAPVSEAPKPQSEGQGVKPEKPASVKLTGSAKEMVEQGLNGKTVEQARADIKAAEDLGKAENDPRIIELKDKRKALGNGRDEATKQAKQEIDDQITAVKEERKALRAKASETHEHLNEVLKTDWDGKSPIANQMPVNPETQLKAEDVADLVTDPKEKAVFDKMAEANKAGVSVRLEHQAEISGSTDIAAKITSAGNVKVPTSTFTPTHFGKTDKGVFAEGYNEAGHIRKYYITKTTEGSQVLKVSKIMDTEAFVGTLPNVELGVRKFKVADVLGKTPAGEAIKTSEAMQAAQAFKDLFKPEVLNQFDKKVQYELKAFKKAGKFDERSFQRMIDKINSNPEEMKKFCKIMGLI